MSMMPDRQREEKSSIFGFTDSATLVSYVPKKKQISGSSLNHACRQ